MLAQQGTGQPSNRGKAMASVQQLQQALATARQQQAALQAALHKQAARAQRKQQAARAQQQALQGQGLWGLGMALLLAACVAPLLLACAKRLVALLAVA